MGSFKSFGRVCPRCGEMKYEQLRTHGHCWNCNYCHETDSVEALLAEYKRNKKLKALQEKRVKEQQSGKCKCRDEKPNPKYGEREFSDKIENQDLC